MFQQGKWPFTPKNLSEIIDRETLAVIEAGCCERIGRSMTIYDTNLPENGDQQVDAIAPRQRFAKFCAYLRNEDHFQGGNAACEQYDIGVARTVATSHDPEPFHKCSCHMGLLNARYVVKVRDHPVAVLLCGQYRPAYGTDEIRERVNELGTERFTHIVPQHEDAKQQLMLLVDELHSAPVDFQARLRREAEHIQRIAEAAYLNRKNKAEQEFLDHLRSARIFGEIEDLQQIRQRMEKLLYEICTFCRCAYVAWFVNVRPGDTVLTPIAQVGVAADGDLLPHFNWKKAGLPVESAGQRQWGFAKGHATWARGIRGDNSHLFADAQYVLATILGSSYRSVLVFGPFAEPINFEQEQTFLFHIGRIIGWSVHTELQILSLQEQQKQWQSRAQLLTHQMRTAITPITTQLGIARFLLQKPQPEAQTKVLNYVDGAHDLCLQLGKMVGETVRSHVLLVEHDDLKFEDFPLSVLVTNCANVFASEAEKRQRRLVAEESVERLPHAEIDIARLTIALSNLIENALKYSYPTTKIHIRAARFAGGSLELENAVIEIQDDGDPIPPEENERIFEQGTRLLTGVKTARKIPGSGLGLWEARAVIEAHGGKIEVRSYPVSGNYKQGQAHRVIFTVKLPLRQPKQIK